MLRTNWLSSLFAAAPRHRRSRRRPESSWTSRGVEVLETRTLLSAGSYFELDKLTASDAAARAAFGGSVAVSADGGTVVVGSRGDDDAGSGSGSAYVYEWDGSGFAETKLTASDAAPNAFFGHSVAVSADGGTVVVGSVGDDDAGSFSGSAYVYEWDGSGFTETKLTASDAALGDFFGESVSVSADGQTVVVGSGLDGLGDSGAVYVYEWDGSGFTETKLTASDAEAGDNFGKSVSVSDGGTVVVGSIGDDDAGSNSGSAYVYEWDGSGFTETKLTASDAEAGDGFGWSVSVSADGQTVVVGSRLGGSAYVYEWDGSGFTETKLTASDAAPDDRFGESVSISADGQTVVVGSSADDDAGSNSGSAYVYKWDGSGFAETKLTASDAASNDFFSLSVSISADGGTVVVGSPLDDDAGSSSGSAYVFVFDDTPPVITLVGDAELTLEAGIFPYSELGTTVTDDKDASVTVLIGGDTVDAGTVGTYVVTYDATDAAGNMAAQVIRTVNVVDTTPPETTIDSASDGKGVAIGESGSTLSEAMSFTFNSNEAGSTFQYSLDGEEFLDATTSLNLTGLADGSHTLQVRAIDGAGNVDLTPASFTWTVLSPLAAIGNLIGDVEALELPTGIDKGLLRELAGAIKKLEDGNPDNDEAAIGKLISFIDKVEEQRGVRLSDDEADSLIAAANEIITEISDDLGLNVFDDDLLALL